jgi:hypothetical protein
LGGTAHLAEILWRMADGISANNDDDARSRVGMRSLLRPIHTDDPQSWRVDFFHRSIREFFVANAIVRAFDAGNQRAADLLDPIPLQPEITNFAVQLMRQNAGSYTETLRRLARSVRRPHPAGLYVGGNALTLLNRLADRLPDEDWSGLALDHAHLADANLTGMTFRGSSLTGANLDNARLINADFRDVDLSGVQLEQTAPTLTLAIDGQAVITAYADGTLRRWSVKADNRVSSAEIARLDFAARSVFRSPFGDLIIVGDREVVILVPQVDDDWDLVVRFDRSPTMIGLSPSGDHLCAHRTQEDVSNVHRFDPVTRDVLSTMRLRGEACRRCRVRRTRATASLPARRAVLRGLRCDDEGRGPSRTLLRRSDRRGDHGSRGLPGRIHRGDHEPARDRATTRASLMGDGAP